MTLTTSSSAPLVVVVGATGSQGGSVVRELAASDKPYRVRALTRDTSKPAAVALAKLGAETHAVNLVLENAAAAREAFKGADIAFIVTNFWDHLSMEQEEAEGKMLVDAAEAAGAKKIIWSGLQSFAEGSKGRLSKVDHFEGKARVTKYGRERFAAAGGIAFVNVDAGFYMSNLSGAFGPATAVRAKGDGTYFVRWPMAANGVVPFIDIHADFGLFVRLAIESEDYAKGGEILTCSEALAATDAVKILSDATGKTIVYEEAPADDFNNMLVGFGLPAAVAAELTENFVAIADPGYYIGKPITSHTKLARKPHTLMEFASAQDWSSIIA